jgi:hypothetical protein
MTVGALLKSALTDLKYPVYPIQYDGDADHYFVYDILDDRGDDFGDDIPDVDHYWIRLKFYYPLGENQFAMRKTVRNLLHGAGFSYADITEVSFPEEGRDGLEWNCEYIAESEVSNG